tara:strand:+ start:182 stop:427 length:246 start_codon:yes stop_codon:yes gene_type:complete
MERPKTTDKECKRQGMTDVPIANYSKMQDKYIDYLEAQAKQLTIPDVVVAFCRCKGKTSSYINYSKDKEICKDCDGVKVLN